jgi:hypothetical protein
MDNMTDLTHLVETERLNNRARLTRPFVRWMDRGCTAVIMAIIVAGLLATAGIVAHLAWGLLLAGWGVL